MELLMQVDYQVLINMAEEEQVVQYI